MCSKNESLKRKFVVISHCILNQNAVVHGLERGTGAYPFAKILVEKEIGIIQLPCPEFLVLGANRPSMNYEDYLMEYNYRTKCQEVLEPIYAQIKEYIKTGYEYLGIIGISHSPNCSILGRRGVLMEEYFQFIANENLSGKFLEVPTWYEKGKEGNFQDQVMEFIS
jgi:predicted secreted protein